MEYSGAGALLLTMRMLFLVVAGFVLSATMAIAAETRFESGPQQTALVELYTSEGCSSCPPAEAWMSRLKSDPGLWKTFVPLAFHVDYWDRLGWPDRFSSKRWTERQRGYASLWQSESVYTPAVVLNGDEVRNWSGANVSRPNEKQVGVLTAKTTDGKTFAIEFRPAGGNTADREAHAALLGSGISSKIDAGENSGRNLQHDFVVLDLSDAEMKSEGGIMRARLTMNATRETGTRKAVAVWISARARLAPVQATGGWLP
jgi:hypothetical protein